MNDRAAFGTYQALNEASLRIPDDVSVLAFEGSELATWLKPKLTTIDRDSTRWDGAPSNASSPDRTTHITERVALTLRTRRSVVTPASNNT